jgi:hypothetical protein
MAPLAELGVLPEWGPRAPGDRSPRLLHAFAQSRVVVRDADGRRGLSIAMRTVMTLRERVWKAIDDAALERHARLQDALYRLLVLIDTVECAPSCVDDCLEHADEALRDGSAVAVMQARGTVEALVALLTVGISSAPCDEKVLRLGRARDSVRSRIGAER